VNIKKYDLINYKDHGCISHSLGPGDDIGAGRPGSLAVAAVAAVGGEGSRWRLDAARCRCATRALRGDTSGGGGGRGGQLMTP
jgi:hypothetical protein